MTKAKKANGKKTTEIVGKKPHEGRAFLEPLIAEGKFSRKELIEKYTSKFKCPASTPQTILTDGKNPKYNKFEKLLIEKDGKILFKNGEKK